MRGRLFPLTHEQAFDMIFDIKFMETVPRESALDMKFLST